MGGLSTGQISDPLTPQTGGLRSPAKLLQFLWLAIPTDVVGAVGQHVVRRARNREIKPWGHWSSWNILEQDILINLLSSTQPFIPPGSVINRVPAQECMILCVYIHKRRG